jgi:hypothetical protein
VRRGPVGSLLAPEGNEIPFVRFEVDGVVVWIERALLEALPAEGGEIMVSLGEWGKVGVEVARAV